MPLNQDYLDQAQHNQRFLDTLDPDVTEFLDWMVTIAFYVAVRYVDAYFYPNLPYDHSDRLRKVGTDTRTKAIYNSYRELFNESRDARYNLVTFTAGKVRGLIHNRLNQVTTHMQRQ